MIVECSIFGFYKCKSYNTLTVTLIALENYFKCVKIDILTDLKSFRIEKCCLHVTFSFPL